MSCFDFGFIRFDFGQVGVSLRGGGGGEVVLMDELFLSVVECPVIAVTVNSTSSITTSSFSSTIDD